MFMAQSIFSFSADKGAGVAGSLSVLWDRLDVFNIGDNEYKHAHQVTPDHESLAGRGFLSSAELWDLGDVAAGYSAGGLVLGSSGCRVRTGNISSSSAVLPTFSNPVLT
jgi:hypothetical protein